MKRWALVVILAAGAAATWALVSTKPAHAPGPAAPPASPMPDLTGFSRVLAPREFTFPLDHGPHSDYQTEWWYYTGNLTTADGRHIGFQLTFFRRALTPLPVPRTSDLAATQLYFAHFALTDVAGGRHVFWERFSRGAAGLAGAEGDPFQVWLEDWRVQSLNDDGSRVRLIAREGEWAIDLVLQAVKPIIAHGDRGLSVKSSEPGNASYYLSFTRMESQGVVTVQGQDLEVRGLSWFDHEWSTSALGAGAVGWDWFSLQLSDGRELMFYQIRLEDGTLEPASQGTLVESDGTAHTVSLDEVSITVVDTWHSRETGAAYPAGWEIEVPGAGLDLRLVPMLADQEMRLSTVYWEGAVRVEGTSHGRAVSGSGYVELTGYAESLQGEL
ncbi:MAG: lipocalin-like domain-containing protein [Chloroflexota bacterium]